MYDLRRITARWAAGWVLSAVCASAVEVDVRTHGAKCDGMHDDAAAIQAAVDALPDEGGIVRITGVCGLGAAGLRIENRKNVVLKGTGEGAGFTHLAAAAWRTQTFGPAMVLLKNCSDCAVEDLTINGNGIGAAAVGLQGCRRTAVRRCTIFDVAYPANAALVGDGNTENRYEENTIERTGEGFWTRPDGTRAPDATRGLWVGNAAEGSTEIEPLIARNVFRHTKATSIATMATGAKILENLIEDCACGPKLVPPVGRPGRSLVEKNVVRRSRPLHGMQLEGPGCRNITVRRNVFEGCWGSGLYVYGGLDDSVVDENEFLDNARNPEGGWKGALMIGHAARTVFARNRIANTRDGAARTQDVGLLFNASGPEAIRDVRVEGNTISGHALHGVVLGRHRDGSIRGVTLTGNVIAGNARCGLLIEKIPAADVTWAGNTFGENREADVRDLREQAGNAADKR